MEKPSAEELAQLLSWVEFLEPLSEEEQGWLARRLSGANLEAGVTFLVDLEEHAEQRVVLSGRLAGLREPTLWKGADPRRARRRGIGRGYWSGAPRPTGAARVGP